MIEKNWILLNGKNSTFALEVIEGAVCVRYWGSKLDAPALEHISALRPRHEAHGAPSIEAVLSLCPTRGSGFMGSAGIMISRDDTGWDFNPKTAEITEKSENRACIRLNDPITQVALAHTIEIDAACDMLKLTTQIINHGDNRLSVHWCAAATLPLPDTSNHITGFTGRWANEFQTQTFEQMVGSFVRENHRGRTSHDSFPGLLAHTQFTSETSGPVYAFHLGWSGNHRLVSEKLMDGRAFIQMGEALLPGEVTLAPGEGYSTPALFASFSNDGFSGASHNFHQFVRRNLTSNRMKTKPRPVHYNTWEAVYFDHDLNSLKSLASKAAEIGVERFVLDDGWFKGRRNDKAGLGDWYVDQSIYPNGLKPLIDHVKTNGMEFGLWVEPEMVNPDSDLYRAHPEWVLSSTTTAQTPSRNQLVLDLTNRNVRDYLFERLDALLTEHDIAYLKWDMNRDIHHPGKEGRPCTHSQTTALYELLKCIREKHPTVEIESCASGGGRADYGILAHTDRIWTSDSNDALDRLVIQLGFSFFFPSEIMGAHVGPRTCHITHRVLPMDLRAATSIFGHMGLEMDLGELSSAEKTTLKSAIRLHKHHRALIHSGHLIRMDSKAHANLFAIISDDQSEALFSYTQVTSRQETLPEIITFKGLIPNGAYQLKMIWPLELPNSPTNDLSYLNGLNVSGETLANVGLQLPIMMPGTALIFYLKTAQV
jgi:alpha-galactosidase